MKNEIFQITEFLDNARWKTKENNNLINFFTKDLSDDSKILTHWICYITDRGMPFRRIWDVGGFIFSELVYKMKKQKDLELLNPNNIEKSFYVLRKEIYPKKKFKKDDEGKYTFRSFIRVKGNEVLLDYRFNNEEFPYFNPRYYPSDYKSILSTFYILKDEEFDFNFTKYIKKILDMYDNEKELITQKLLYALYLLTYYDIGQPKASDVSDFQDSLSEVKARSEKVHNILSSKALFDNEFEKFVKSANYFKQKRAWCSLRDYLKSKEFNNYFFSSLLNDGYQNIDFLSSESLLKQLELPGDTWNNNPKFRNCILKNSVYESSKYNMPKLIRTIYDKEKIEIGYPEIFDITFDFVPRMCESNNCSICPYGLIQKKAEDFEKFCIKNPKKFCTVALTCCNYKINCYGERCELLQIYEASKR